MENLSKWQITDEEKDHFISALTPELVLLRTKAEISQEDLASITGISRQTYGAIERKARKMTWNTYLSLIMFYDYNQKTHGMLHSMGIFPKEIIKRFNDGAEPTTIDIGSFLSGDMKNIVESLDEQALRSIRTMIMVEYARCTETPGEVVVKSFDGVSFTNGSSPNEKEAMIALKNIKESRKANDRK